MSLLELIHAKRDDIISPAAPYGATNFRIFGSGLEGKENPNDIDFRINYKHPEDPRYGGWHFYGLGEKLEKMLGLPVHPTQEELLKPHYTHYILPMARAI